MNLMVTDGIKALLTMQSSKMQAMLTEHQTAICELQEQLKADNERQAEEVSTLRA